MRCITAALVAACWALAPVASAQAQNQDDYRKAFDTLQSNAQKALKAAPKATKEIVAKGAGGKQEKFILTSGCQVEPVICPERPEVKLDIAVKIYGESVQPGPGGRREFFNLAKHKFERKERFWLWIETAAPVQLSLFQVFPEDARGNPTSEIRSPDPKFPATFRTIMPGEPYRFPVLIQADDNLLDEFMSIVVVSATGQVLPINGGPANTTPERIIEITQQQTTTIIAPPKEEAGAGGGAFNEDAAVKSMQAIKGAQPRFTTVKKMKKGDKDVFIVDSAPGAKFIIVAPPPEGAPPSSHSPDDVSILLMKPGYVGQTVLTLHKD